jgi:hypothetical protein
VATLPATPSVGDSLMIVNNDNDATDSYNVQIDAGGTNEIRQQNIVAVPIATLVQGQTALLVCYEAGATKRWHMQRWVSSLDIGGGGGGGMTVTEIKTANYTASVNEVVPVDSSAGSFTITFPAGTPAAQSRIIVIDVGKACSTYPVTLGRNSNNFDGVAADFVIDQDHGRVDASFDGVDDWALHLIGTPELVNVNSFATGFNGVNAQTGTTYEFVEQDLVDLVTASNGAASTYDIADDFAEVGETLNLLNIGAGLVTITVAGTDTLASTANTVPEGNAVTIVKHAAGSWWVVGGIA